MLSFVVSFLVIGQFWIAHHRMFGRLRGYDTALVWLNLISLLSVCFLPFPTAVLGARSGHDQFPVIFYAVSMTVTSLFFTLTSLYALSRLDLVKPDLDRRTRREYAVRSVTTTSVFAVSVGAAYFGLYVAMTFWLVVLPVVRRVVLRHSRGPAAVSQEAP
jgi:uncharacterized membrane protein